MPFVPVSELVPRKTKLMKINDIKTVVSDNRSKWSDRLGRSITPMFWTTEQWNEQLFVRLSVRPLRPAIAEYISPKKGKFTPNTSSTPRSSKPFSPFHFVPEPAMSDARRTQCVCATTNNNNTTWRRWAPTTPFANLAAAGCRLSHAELRGSTNHPVLCSEQQYSTALFLSLENNIGAPIAPVVCLSVCLPIDYWLALAVAQVCPIVSWPTHCLWLATLKAPVCSHRNDEPTRSNGENRTIVMVVPVAVTAVAVAVSANWARDSGYRRCLRLPPTTAGPTRAHSTERWLNYLFCRSCCCHWHPYQLYDRRSDGEEEAEGSFPRW